VRKKLSSKTSALESARRRKEPSSFDTKLPRLSLGEVASVEGLNIELAVLTEQLVLVKGGEGRLNGGDGGPLGPLNGGDGGSLGRLNGGDGLHGGDCGPLSRSNGGDGDLGIGDIGGDLDNNGLLWWDNGGVSDLLCRPREYLAKPVL
jgi:hypothetical protein